MMVSIRPPCNNQTIDANPIMKIAKPLLLVSTPIGTIWGVVVAWQMKPWFGVLMAILLTVISIFIGYTVHVIRREQQQSSQSRNPSSPIPKIIQQNHEQN